MDFGSLIGIIAGLSLIFSAIFLGGDIHNFLNIYGLMIVIGGTASAILLTFQLKDVTSAFKAAYFVFTIEKHDPNRMVATMVALCDLTRQKGILELTKIETQSPFLKKACRLIADGTEEEQIRNALSIEIESLQKRHFIIQDVFRKMGTYSPAFGMLGTLIGLVQMLSKLQEPSNIGPAMAVALLTTFYGSLLSTLFFLPIAGKLKIRTVMQVLDLEIMFEGAITILSNNNPFFLYEKLSSFIPAKKRIPLEEMRKSS